MSIEAAIAQITAAIERREDEIVALREVMAMLQNDRGVAVATPEPPPKPRPPPPKPAAATRTAESDIGKGRGGGHKNVARQINGHSLSLSPRLAAMFDALMDGPVSREASESLLGAGQSRHDGINFLKKKLAPTGFVIAWDKAQGGYVLTEGKS